MRENIILTGQKSSIIKQKKEEKFPRKNVKSSNTGNQNETTCGNTKTNSSSREFVKTTSKHFRIQKKMLKKLEF